MPYRWQIGFQDSASFIMDYVIGFHNLMLIIMSIIMVAITGTMVYILVRFNRCRNPFPSKVSDNVSLEIAGLLLGFVICAIIFVPSISLLKYEEMVPKSEMTVKIVGHQWYWTYYYPDYGKISFDSNLKTDLAPGEPRLLEVDNRLFLPTNTNIRILVTSSDVIHSWAVPSLGVKKDAIPGRLNETWVNIKAPGVYYGQCSELCGVNHAFMPIAIQAVSKDEFEGWIENLKKSA